MNAAEKRQANRIIRNAREPEWRFFELIQELQDARHDDEAYDWQSAINHLKAIEGSLPLLFDLVRNIQRETRGAP